MLSLNNSTKVATSPNLINTSANPLIFLQRHAFLQIALVELLFLEICGYPFLLRDPHISNGTIYAQLGNLLVGRRMTKIRRKVALILLAWSKFKK